VVKRHQRKAERPAGRDSAERTERRRLIAQVREANEHLVIANLRAQTLSEEAEHAYQRVRVQYAATRILADSPSLSDVYPRILQTVAEGAGWEFGAPWEVDRESHELRCKEVWHPVGSQVARLERLVGHLLDVTRIRAGRLDLELEDLEFSGIVQAAVDRVRGELKDGDLILRLSPASGCSDRLRLDQIVTNLLSNAVKYGEGKPIEVLLEPEDDTVRLSVTDHGIGIAPESQKRLFEPFERAVSRRHYGGFGLGLWITRQIVDAMRGQISVDSRPGQGSTFSVVIPRTLSLTPSNRRAEASAT
jgi:signal transduction histidine kinase